MEEYKEEKNIEETKDEKKDIKAEDNEKDKKQGDLEKESKKGKKAAIITTISIIVLLVLLILSTGFALLNINNSNIVYGIKVKGIDIGGLEKEQAKIKLEEALSEELSKIITLEMQDFTYSIEPNQIEARYNIEEIIELACKEGKNSNIIVNNFQIMIANIFGKNIEPELLYNQELLKQILSDVNTKIPKAVIETSYYIENDKLIITKGKPGNSINKEFAKQDILNSIKGDKNTIALKINYTEPQRIDIEKIYNEVHREPQDAYYTKEPYEVFAHVNGIDFDIEEAKKILGEDKEEYEIQLIITVPKKTTDQIGSEAFPDLLSLCTTKYDASNTGRTTNLRLAANKLNGVVVMPGETFSYNKTLGERTISKGYKEAAGYASGKVVQTLGGGICQISSTLYDAVVYANLDIVERKNHAFLTSYIEAGKDATVVYGSIDFKFKNTRKYPIMLKSSVQGGIAKIQIYGVKEDVEYEVEISTKILSYNTYKTVYEEDSSLGAGKQVVTQKGMNGCKSITYKILKLNGAEVSRKVLSSDTYDAMNKIIKKGPEATTTNAKSDVTPVVQPDPEPENNNTSATTENTNTNGTGNNIININTTNTNINTAG